MRHKDFKYQMCIIAVFLHFTSLQCGKRSADCIFKALEEKKKKKACVLLYLLGLTWRCAHEDIIQTDVIIPHDPVSSVTVCLMSHWTICCCSALAWPAEAQCLSSHVKDGKKREESFTREERWSCISAHTYVHGVNCGVNPDRANSLLIIATRRWPFSEGSNSACLLITEWCPESAERH